MGGLQKTPSGITGLDEVLMGGLPKGRPTLFFGGPGCGKSILSMEILCHGALKFNEPGLFVSFEESVDDMKQNFHACGYGFDEAVAAGSVRIESIPLINHLSETGEFTLDGLLFRLEHLLEASGANRLVLDGINSLFDRFSDIATLRSELTRILKWTKHKGTTTIVTSQVDGPDHTRFKLEEYASDCVILLDHRIREQIAKRRLRVLKYRGSTHGLDEYPMLITTNGINIFPITSVGLESDTPNDFISSGIDGLNEMLAGKGYYRGSTVLVSGGAGTGKSSLALTFANDSCVNGGRSLYLSFEESLNQIRRNMGSIGIDLNKHIADGRLLIQAIRPSISGLEEHLARINMLIEEFQPDTVVLDPISSFTPIGNRMEIRALLTRTLDYFKKKQITCLLTNLTFGSGSDEETETAVSSIVDVWVIIQYMRTATGRRTRRIYIHKARGIAHSHDLGELVFSNTGISVIPLVENIKK